MAFRLDKNLKLMNRMLVFNYIYNNGPRTRKDLAYELDISLPTLAQHIKTLCADGLMDEVFLDDKNSSGMGRKAKFVVINPEAAISIGMSIKINDITFVALDLFGKQLFSEVINIKFENSDSHFKALGDLTENFIQKFNISKEKVVGIGISFSGIVYESSLFSHKLHIPDMPIENLVRYIPYKTTIKENSYCAANNEIHKQNEDISAFYIWLGDCVTGSIIHNGQLSQTAQYHGSQIGHMQIVANGREHFCGHKGCLDAYCSSDVLTEQFNYNLDKFFNALQDNDVSATKTWNEYLKMLALGLNTIHLVVSEGIIIGGPVARYMKPYKKLLKDYLCQHDVYNEHGEFLQFSEEFDNVEASGAGLLILSQYLKELADNS